jgi:hypothetical protein
MSNIYATKRPRIQRNKSTIIALALTLTIAATLITGLPFTFGQELAGELDKKPLTGAGVIAMPYTVGINQEVLIWGMLIPMPKEGDVYHDLIFNITKPDDTVDTIIHDSNGIAQYHFYYNCDQVGTYSVKLLWLGDEDYLGAASTSQTWTVQEEATPPLEKIDVYAYTSAQPNPIGVKTCG